MRMEGKLIVLEGTDGSGKSTQFSLLCRRMEAEGQPFHRIVFPQYQEPSSALGPGLRGGEADPLGPLYHLQRRPSDRQAARIGVGGLFALALRF